LALFAALFVSRKLESTIYPNPDPDVLVSLLKSSAIIYMISVSPSLILKHEIFLLRLIRLSKNAQFEAYFTRWAAANGGNAIVPKLSHTILFNALHGLSIIRI
jgi:hypothetical protein